MVGLDIYRRENLTELEKLAESATNENMRESGETFVGHKFLRLSNGVEYKNPHDGKLLASLWNMRRAGSLVEAQCCMCGEYIVPEEDVVERQLDDGRWTCSASCWDKAVPIHLPKGVKLWGAASVAAHIIDKSTAGRHYSDEEQGALILDEQPTIIDRTTADDGKWAFANAPTVEVEVIHIMQNGDVVVLDAHSTPQVRNKFGEDKYGGTAIIHLQRQPREVFVAGINSLSGEWFKSEALAKASGHDKPRRFVEVLDDE